MTVNTEIDPCRYVRNAYHVPATVGMHVIYRGRQGVIQGATQHVQVLLRGDSHTVNIHPTDPDLVYLTPNGPNTPRP